MLGAALLFPSRQRTGPIQAVRRRVFLWAGGERWYLLTLRCRVRFKLGYGYYYPLRALSPAEVGIIVSSAKANAEDDDAMLAQAIGLLFLDEALEELLRQPSRIGERIAQSDLADEPGFPEHLEQLESRLKQLHDDLDGGAMSAGFMRRLLEQHGQIETYCDMLDADPTTGLSRLFMLVLRTALQLYLHHHGLGDLLHGYGRRACTGRNPVSP